jgi:DNA-binding MarR family transcriptional regulator
LVDLKVLFNEVVRLEIELWNAVEGRLKSELDLPLTHYEPMTVMERFAGCRVYEIASELVITAGGASKLVDRIEEKGYCRRRPNPDDRRSSILELTPAGRGMLARARTVVDDELQRRLGDAVPEGELRDFVNTVGELRSAVRRVDLEERTA